MNFLEKFQPLLSKFKSARPPLEKHYALLMAILIGYMSADLGLLYVRPNMLPKEAPPIKPSRAIRSKAYNLAEYNIIYERNIFNEDGVIPPALGATKDNQDNNLEREPVLSQLPIQLLGTIVHFNPKMSIATVSLTSKSLSMSYKVGEIIDDLAEITKIERKKIIFINLSNRTPEYIEIPEDAILNFGLQSTAPKSTGIIDQKGRFEFSIRRADLEGLTQNLSALLQQARMEPVFSPDGIGVEGFRFVNIQAGSIYEKLGFKIGDMIRSVNNEPVNSPTKAMEMYNTLKSSNSVQLGVERDGREERFNYSIQ
ncbi:MAG: general secretion pathway protein GspC [Bdellovibrionales bacterium]|nr:general secretion pathway protein GspC [Bdellovibrionales bacterium]